MIEDIHALNSEMIAAGAGKFACGISRPATQRRCGSSLDGTVLVTDGPYTETKELLFYPDPKVATEQSGRSDFGQISRQDLHDSQYLR